MHCQYYKKQLTSEQQIQNALARCKNARKALMQGVQSKNTEYTSTLKLTVKVPKMRKVYNLAIYK